MHRTLLVSLLGLTTAIAAARPLPAQILPLDGEVVFTPLTPCRRFDSRDSQPLRPGQVLSLGVKSYCGIPVDPFGGVRAVAVNLVAVGAEGPGHLSAWPAHRDKPFASVINYGAGATIANGLILEVCSSGLPCPSGDLSFEAAVSATHLVVDIVGFFAPPVRPGARRYGAGAGDSFLCVNNAQSVRFGLSHLVVDWIHAELACPASTWVCSPQERGSAACNTSRPDGTCDLVSANGACTDLAADAHRGWTRPRSYDGADVGTAIGTTVDEQGAPAGFRFGSQLPVWCCSSF